jgi:hypothetical protein
MELSIGVLQRFADAFESDSPDAVRVEVKRDRC